MKARIRRSSPVPIYRQIASAVRWMISTGELRFGEQLTATREAGKLWGVNRHTVRQAYLELAEMGFVESRPPGRFVVTDNSRHKDECNDENGASANRLHEFLDDCLKTAHSHHGLTPVQFSEALLQRSAIQSGTVVVVECNTTQVRDMSEQLKDSWEIHSTPFILGSSDILPEGQIVCSLFHYEDVRKLWPERLTDARFVPVSPDPLLAGEAQALLSTVAGETTTIGIMGDQSVEEAMNLSVDLQGIFPESRYRHQQLSREQWLADKAPNKQLTLVGPRCWDSLSEEQQNLPNLLCIRYRMDTRDIEAIGQHFRWQGAQGR